MRSVQISDACLSGTQTKMRHRSVIFVLMVTALTVAGLTHLSMAAGENPAATAWKQTQQDVAKLISEFRYEQALEKTSEFIKSNPEFGPAYERRVWITLDWLDLRDELALTDVPLRRRPMADPAVGLGNTIAVNDARRVFLEDTYHLKYTAPAEFKSVERDLAACKKLLGKDFDEKPIAAFVAEFTGNYGRAKELLGSRCKEGTATPREYLAQSRISRLQGDIDGALTAAEAAWKAPETRSQAASRAVNMLRAMNRMSDAQSFLDGWQEAGERDPRLLNIRMAFTTDGEAILTDFRQMKSLMPSEPGINYGIATREMQFHKDINSAMAELDRAIDLKTKSLLPYYARSCLWAKRNDAKSAAADANAAIDCNPLFDMSYHLRAKALRRLGDVEGARRDEHHSLWLQSLYGIYVKCKSNPKDADAVFALGEHYARNSDWNLSLPILSACLTIDPKHEGALRQRCQSYLALGKFEPALADASAVVAIAPEPGSYSLRGDVYSKRKDWDKAVKDYERAKCLDERLETALRQRSEWHAAAGRVEPAKADLERANRVSQASFVNP